MKSDHQLLKSKLSEAQALEIDLIEYLEVLTTIEKIQPTMLQLLQSKNTADVVEIIQVLLYLRVHNIQSAERGINRMLSLIWSKEKNIKERVIEAYWVLFFDEKKYKAEGVAKNMIQLFKNATLSDKTSLEELLKSIVLWDDNLEDKEKEKKKGAFYFRRVVYDNLWEIFHSNIDQED